MSGRDTTALLNAVVEGDRSAGHALLPRIYEELRRIAHNQLRKERQDHTLCTTALVHEAYLKLIKLDRIEWQGRAHFFAIASRAMRNILINYATQQKAQKRGGNQIKVQLDEERLPGSKSCEDLLVLDAALTRLNGMNERQAQVVEFRFFGGLSIEETAEALSISPATVKRDWEFSRAWLNRELSGGPV